MSSPRFACPNCPKTYARKGDLTRHEKICTAAPPIDDPADALDMAIKANALNVASTAPTGADCTTGADGAESVQSDDTSRIAINEQNKGALITLFKSVLNILRDSEGLTGEKALRNMSLILIIKLIEPHINKTIMFNEPRAFKFFYDAEYRTMTPDFKEKLFKRQCERVYWTNLVNYKPAVNLPDIMRELWTWAYGFKVGQDEDPEHYRSPLIKIFDSKHNFDITKGSTYTKIFAKFEKIELVEETDYDLLGAAYEEVIKDVMIGKVLGQFFTPPAVKKVMVDLIEPQLWEDGTFESCCDPAMGTAGFLSSYMHNLAEQSKISGVKINWAYAHDYGIYGQELEPDTHKLALSNMLIATGQLFKHLETGDSIRGNGRISAVSGLDAGLKRQYDVVLANPPFGVKGIEYADFAENVNDPRYGGVAYHMPIPSKSATTLFLQMIIRLLKVGGRAAIVMPDGQDLFGKNNKTLIAARQYLMKTCELRQVLHVPAGTFTNTSVRTCILYFVKRRECSEVINYVVGGYHIKAQEWCTTQVEFYEYESSTPTELVGKRLVITVPIAELSANGCSLNYADYVKVAAPVARLGSGVQFMKLDDVFGPRIRTTIILDDKTFYNVLGLSKKEHAFISKKITGSDLVMKTQNVAQLGQFAVSKIASGAYGIIKDHVAGAIASSEFWLFNINPEIADTRFISYIFTDYILKDIGDISNGACMSRLDYDKFNALFIPVPPLDVQAEIVAKLDASAALVEALEKEIKDVKATAKTALANVLE